MSDLKNLAETLVNLTVKDVNELAAILKDEYGIEPAAAAVVVAAGGAADAAEEARDPYAYRGLSRRDFMTCRSFVFGLLLLFLRSIWFCRPRIGSLEGDQGLCS